MRDYENVVLDLRERASSYEQMFGEGESSIVMKDAADAIEELVELVPKRGTWIGSADGYADGELVYDMWECSVCGFDADGADERPDWSYCPHCGAKMEVSEDA